MRVILRIVTALLAGLLLSGCVASVDAGSMTTSQPTSSAGGTAVVARMDITPILTLPAIVSDATVLEVTAARSGVYGVNDAGQPVVHDDAGATHVVGPAGLQLVENIAKPGDAVVPGLPVARMRAPGFSIVAEVSGADLLRFLVTPEGARAQISGAGAPFQCLLLDPVPSPSAGSEATRFVACRVPTEATALSGLSAILAVQFPGKRGVLALPVEAVAGSLDSASVFIETPTGPLEKTIRVGISDGLYIEVREGLLEGETVLLPSPSLLGQ